LLVDFCQPRSRNQLILLSAFPKQGLATYKYKPKLPFVKRKMQKKPIILEKNGRDKFQPINKLGKTGRF